MLEFVALLTLGVAAVLVFGVLFSLGSLLLWLIVLPFKLIGFVFRGLALLFALPFLLIAAVVGVLVFGLGFMVFLTPAVPLIALVALVWWLVRRVPPATRTT
jgi:hypothetical protein